MSPPRPVIRLAVRCSSRFKPGRPGLWRAFWRTLSLGTGLIFWTALGAEPAGFFFISEYRVLGVHSMSSLEVESAVTPFLGPDRIAADVRGACAALEKAYQAKGFGAATVRPVGPPDRAGLVELEVTEGTVKRLRVRGARYFSPAKIRAAAPSLAEGRVLNFNDINRDVVGLNQLPERTVTPTLQPGAEPGTYDIDLTVKDSRPVHASLELNNNHSPNTKPLRVTASVSDSNLRQSGQGAGFSFEEAPQRRRDSEVFSGYYVTHFAGSGRTSLMLQGTKQDSNISTLGGATVAGPGETLELRATVALPNGKNWDTGKDWENFSHSISLSLDYKHFRQSVDLAPATGTSAGTLVTPITYYPLTASYAANWFGGGGKGSVTTLDASATMHFRGAGSGPHQFNLNRFGADGGFIYFRGDLSRTQVLPGDWQLYGKIQGQVANQPLVSSEEYSGGGEATVRGYLESEVVGDDGYFGSLEVRTPPVFLAGKKRGDWRFYLFGDAGRLTLIDPLPEQLSRFTLASVGLGSRLAFSDHVGGACDAAFPLVSQTYTPAHDVRLNFRVWLNY